MDISIGRNRNIYDSPVLRSAILLNPSTSVELAPANSDRSGYIVTNNGNQKVWIKEQDATVDNDKKGWALLANSVATPPGFTDLFYIGPISAIADKGNPSVTIQEIQ